MVMLMAVRAAVWIEMAGAKIMLGHRYNYILSGVKCVGRYPGYMVKFYTHYSIYVA